jgi:hypothetical protein
MTRSWIAIGSLGLTALGTVFAGMQLWSGSGSEPSAEATKAAAAAMPAQETLKADCGIATQNSGTVNIDCSKNIKVEVAPTVKPFDKFQSAINLDSYLDFKRFVDSHDGKIVEISASAEPIENSKILSVYKEEDGYERLIITISEECEDGAFDCGGVEYLFSTKEGGEIYWANGEYKIDGYYSVEPTQGMHQGYVSVVLKGVSSGQARLTDPTAR